MEKENIKVQTIRKGELLDIPLDKLFPYMELDWEADITQLVESIKAVGILQPLVVIRPYKLEEFSIEDPYGQYYLVLDGLERLRAIEQINKESLLPEFTEVPCFVLHKKLLLKHSSEDADALSEKLLWLALKTEVRDKNKTESLRFKTLEVLDLLFKHKEIKKSEVTDFFQSLHGVSERYADMYYKIFKHGIKELIKKVISSGYFYREVSISVEAAAKIASYRDYAQEQILIRVKKGEKLNEILKDYENMKRHKCEDEPF